MATAPAEGGEWGTFFTPLVLVGPRTQARSRAAVRRGSSNEAANQPELAVAHFCFNRAVRFANVLPEVPSPKPSLFARCVESSFSDCISIKVSLVAFER